MFDYSFAPPRDIKKCSIVPLLGFLLGFGFVYISNFLPYSTIFQVVGLGILTVAIFFATRYVIKRYVYSTREAGNGDYDFVVNEISGKRSRVVCRINSDDITDFIYSPNGKVPEKYSGKAGRDILRYDYCQDFMPKEAYYLYAHLKEGKVCIKFSPDQKMAEIITELSKKIEL